MGSFRWELGVRGVVLVMAAAIAGIAVGQRPGPTGAAILAGLLLLLADFHGDPHRRLRAYLITGTAGAVMVGLTVLAGGLPTAAFAVIVAALTAVLMALRATGGMLAAACTCLMADVLVGAAGGLAKADPVTWTLGALLGGLAATALAFAIAPAPWVSPVRRGTLETLRTCSAVLRGQEPPSALQGVPRDLIEVYLERPERPSAPVPSALASVDLLSDLTFVSEILERLPTTEPGGDTAERCAQLLDASRALLQDPDSSAARAQLEHLLTQAPPQPAEQDEATEASFADDVLRSGCAGIARHSLSMSARSGPSRTSWRAFRTDMAVRLSPGSTLVPAAIASGLLFGVLVWVAGTAQLSHPQWLLLVAVSSFYPYVRKTVTKATAIVLGTLLGAVAFVGLLGILDAQSHWWWVVLAAASAVSMAAPSTTRGVLLGQAAFTLLSLSLLELATTGITTATARERLLDVALGAAAAVLVATLLAPRNLRLRLCTGIAALFDTAAQSLAASGAGAPAAAGTSNPSMPALARSQFLRCVDVVAIMGGSKQWEPQRLVAWLDASRLAGQAVAIAALRADDKTHSPEWEMAHDAYRQQAIALRSGQPMPSHGRTDEPPVQSGDWLLRNTDTQAHELATLVPPGAHTKSH